MTFDPSIVRLGKKSPRHDLRTLFLARYMTALPPAPAAVDYSNIPTPYGAMDNNSLGCCTISAAGHLIQAWTGNAAPPGFVPADSDILTAYEQSCGYKPGDPSTDQGGVEIDVLGYWKNTGIAGRKIAAYASINPKNVQEVMQAIDLFGGIYTGVSLPTSAQNQVGSLWDVTASSPGDAGGWGGHALPILQYDSTGLTCITWGAKQKMTWAWLQAYMDEAYAIITQDWIEADGQAPSGFNLAQLQADLAQIE
jgi:hypothetical protein